MPKICTTMFLDHSSYCLSPSNLEMVDMGKLNKDIERTIITKNCPKTLASDSVTKQVCGSAEFEKWYQASWKNKNSSHQASLWLLIFRSFRGYNLRSKWPPVYLNIKQNYLEKRSRSKKYPYTTIECLNLPKLQRLQSQIKEAASIFDLPPSHAKSNSQIHVKVI